MCKWLGVSPSGYYAWKSREESKRSIADKELLVHITKAFVESEGRYGSPRVFKRLREKGISVGENRVCRLMREAGLKARVTRVTRRQPGLRRFQRKGENLLRQVEKPTGVNQIWGADVTYLKANGKWQYLATVMDLYSRRIVGWSLSASRTAELTCAALRYAFRKRGNPSGILFHTDRGVEYTGSEFQELLCAYGFRHSLNRPGQCTDNAFMESFFHSLKAELIRGTLYGNAKELRKALAGYINKFYNCARLHSSLNYMSPIKYEQIAA